MEDSSSWSIETFLRLRPFENEEGDHTDKVKFNIKGK